MKVTDDTKNFTCSRLPILMGAAHPKALSKNELLQEFIDKKNGSWIEPEQNNYSRYTDYFEQAIQKIVQEDFPTIKFKKGANEKPYLAVSTPLACSIDDWAIAKDPIHVTDPLGQTFTMQGDILIEYKTTSVVEDSLPLYKGPIQVQGQMICTHTSKAIVVVFNIRTWEIQYWPIFEHKDLQGSIKETVRDFWDRRNKEKYYDPEKPNDYNIVYPNPKEDILDLSGNNFIGDAINTWHEGNQEVKSGKEKIEKSQDIIKQALGDHANGQYNNFKISWPIRNYKAKPEKIVPAQAAYSKRQSTISIKEE